MSYGFTQIPLGFRTFGIHVENDSSRAIASPPALTKTALIVAPQLLSVHSEGDVVPVPSKDAATEAFGAGSIAEQMCHAFLDTQPNVPLSCAPIDDESGTAATGDIDFTGTATAAGEIALYIQGYRVAVAVVVGDTAADLETKAVAAIQAVQHKLGVTAAADGANDGVDLTARHDGTFGNQIDLRHSYHDGEKVPAGISVTITAMNGGATDPVITDALNNIGSSDKWSGIAHPFIDATNIASMEADMVTRWDAMDQRRGMAFTALGSRQGDGTAATHTTQQTLTDERNSPYHVIGTNLSPVAPWVKAASLMAIDLGHSDPAVPRRNSMLRGLGMLAPARTDRFTRTQRDTLLNKGGTTFVVDDGGNMLVERLITTYQTNASSNPDASQLDVNTLRITEKVDFDIQSRFGTKYAKAKLADDGVDIPPGQTILTPTVAIGEIVDLAEGWLQQGIVQRLPDVSAGEVVATLNASNPGRLDIAFNPHYMLQFRGMAVLNQFLLTTE